VKSASVYVGVRRVSVEDGHDDAHASGKCRNQIIVTDAQTAIEVVTGRFARAHSATDIRNALGFLGELPRERKKDFEPARSFLNSTYTLVLAVQEHLTVWLIGFVVPVLLIFWANVGRDDRPIATAPLTTDEAQRSGAIQEAVLLGGLGDVLWLGGGLVTIGFLVWLAAVMVQHFLADTTMANFDSIIARAAREHSRRAMFYATWHAAKLGSSQVTAVVVVETGLAMRLRVKTWRPLTILGLVYAGSVILEIALKMTIVRAQPPAGWIPARWGSSFPSGHSARAAAIYGAWAHLVGELRSEWRGRLWTVAILTALIVGISVVYLGMHWSTDVTVGWIVGAAWLGLVISRFRRLIF